MKVLVSACLMGENVRYDGGHNRLYHDSFESLDIVTCCPEVDGGLSIPRVPAEIRQDKVINKEGKDVTIAFEKGAGIALDLIKKYDIKVAILKSNSPSCGNKTIYDGTFSKNLVEGVGVTVSLLQKHGVLVFNEHQLEEAFAFISRCEEENRC